MAEHNYDIYTPQGEGSLTIKIISGLLVLFFALVSVQTYIAFKNPYEHAKIIYKQAVKAYKLFPEGEDFYKLAVESSINLIKIKQKLINSYGYEGDFMLFLRVLESQTSLSLKWKFFKNLFLAAFAKWFIFLGLLIGIIHKTFWGFVILFLLTVAFVMWKGLNFFSWLKVNFQAWRLAKLKDKDILNVIKVLLTNPRPASLYHHESGENGLLKHSLGVASLAVEKAKEENLRGKEEKLLLKDVYLAGLLHDIGKIKLYTKTDKGNWISIGAKQEVVNQLTLQELKEKFGIREITDNRIWQIVKSADREQTVKELWTVFKSYLFETDIKSLLTEIIPKTNYCYLMDKNLIIVPAKEINALFTEKLNDLFPDLNFKEDEVDYFTGIHPVAIANPYKPFVILRFDDKIADKFDLFNVSIDGKTFPAYLFDNSKLQLDLRPCNKKVEVKERKTVST